jgi:hypothetical protein
MITNRLIFKMCGPIEFIHSKNYLLIPGSPHAPGIRDPPAPILLNALKLEKPLLVPRSYTSHSRELKVL